MRKIVNINKISIRCEGETEYELIKFLKNNLYKFRFPIYCDEHKRNTGGTFQNKEILSLKKTQDCCYVVYVMDTDDLSKVKLDYFSKTIKDNKGLFILTCPSIEIVLLSIFMDCSTILNYSQDQITKKLNDKLKEYKIDKYTKRNLSSLKKILLFLESNPNNIRTWELNLRKINFKDKGTNFIELIDLLKSFNSH